jgi:TonB-dependent receptor
MCYPRATLLQLLICFVLVNLGDAQTPRAGIVGHVTDVGGAIIQHARVELQPGAAVATTDDDGNFTFSGIAPGTYTLTISNVGFSIFTSRVDVQGSTAVRVDAVLKLGTQNEAVTVHADREGGELEALDIQRTADNIVQVLPADVITSLPNTNIADALGRLPSVSLERDEGEGKYVQIRGTEPRLSNVTVNGIHLPSPEGVRNVKLDAIPADLVESVEINKTLSANQDADAIGGSVNLVTRTPIDEPYVSLMGMAGYTPITGGRDLYQIEGTIGERFGHSKKFGALFGFSYDHNNRGINDVEPAYPGDTTFFNGLWAPNTADLRDYHYDRGRYGFDGEVDYRLGDMSSVYLRGLFSHFNDNGENWAYTPTIDTAADPSTCNPGSPVTSFSGPTGCGNMNLRNTSRRPGQQLVSVQAGARHPFGKTLVIYELALSEASYTGGFSAADLAGPGLFDGSDSVAFGVDTTHPFTPKFPVLNGVNIYDPTTYFLTDAETERDSILERDIVGDISLSRAYSLAGHSSTFEVGFKGWNARKSSLTDRQIFNGANGQPMTDFLSSFRDTNYYFGQYTYGPVTSFNKIRAAIAPAGTTFDVANNFSNTFDINERIWAGYVMDTINFGNFRVQGGIRVESTQDDLHAFQLNFDPNTGNFVPPPVPLATTNSYINVFPSVQAQYRFGADTTLRMTYGIGIARPNFGDIAPFRIVDPNASPTVPVSLGNPSLKPTHAQNFDVLLEHYFNPHGLIQGGFFYKALTDPIYESVLTPITSGQFAGKEQSEPLNGPSAHLSGIEMAWQQGLSFLPGALNGMGVSANYSYVTSQASFPVGFGRTDHPTLVRTAPNNWNFDVTYDKKGVSARMGLSHNDANLWSYGPSNLKDPSGDTYLYPHTQVDAQISYWIPRGHGLQMIVSGLNLNNEVFGFYNGAERFPIQREYYNRTISAGLRWTLGGEAP